MSAAPHTHIAVSSRARLEVLRSSPDCALGHRVRRPWPKRTREKECHHQTFFFLGSSFHFAAMQPTTPQLTRTRSSTYIFIFTNRPSSGKWMRARGPRQKLLRGPRRRAALQRRGLRQGRGEATSLSLSPTPKKYTRSESVLVSAPASKIPLSIRPNAQPPPLCRLEKLASARPTVEESAALQKVRLRLRCWSQQPRGVAAAHGRASVVVACVTPPRLRVHAAGCTKSAQSSTQFCVWHGGGRKCMVEGCSKVGKRRTARSLSPRPRRTEFEVCALNMCAMLVFWCVRWTGMFGVGWRALVFQVSRGTTKLCASHAKTPRCACGHIAVSRIASCSTCTLLLLLSQLRRTPHSLATSPKACLNCCGCCLASD